MKKNTVLTQPFSEAIAAAEKATSTKTLTRRIGLLTRCANRGACARTTMPTTTGTMRVAIVSSSLPPTAGMVFGSAAK